MKTYIDHNALDDLLLDELILESKVLQQYIVEGNHHFDNFPVFIRDIIFLLYKHTLRMDLTSKSINCVLLKEMKTLKAMTKLRLRTVGSLSNTYLSLKFILDGLFESVRGRDVLNDIKELLTDTSEDKLHAQLQVLNSVDLDDLFNQKEMDQLQALVGKLNKDHEMDLTSLDFLEGLMKKLNDDIAEKKLDDLLEEVFASNPEDFTEMMDYFLDDEKETDIISDPDVSGIKDQLDQKFDPFINNQYLIEGQNFNEGKMMNELNFDTPEDKRVFSSNAIKEKDQMIQASGHEIDTTLEENLRGQGHFNAWHKEKIDHYSKDNQYNLKQALKQLKLPRIINKAISSVDDFMDNTKTLGIDTDSMNQLSFDEVILLHRKYRKPDFIRFINKVGKNKLHASIMQYKKKKRHAIPINKITLSSDIDLLIEDEFISLALEIEAFENDFYDRYLRDDLLTLDMIEKHDKHKGPIILCYDGSGSMEGIKIEETQSHILAIMEIAKIQKRHMIIIQFAAASEPLYIKEINPKYITAQDITDILETFICGGTNFEKPLSKAIEYIKADKHKKSDILFITDGQCEIKQKFKDKFMTLKHERDFKLYTLIMHSYTYHDYGDIGDISDEIMEIQEKDFNNWNTATNEKLYSLI